MKYQRGRKEPRRSAAGLDAAWKKLLSCERVEIYHVGKEGVERVLVDDSDEGFTRGENINEPEEDEDV